MLREEKMELRKMLKLKAKNSEKTVKDRKTHTHIEKG